MDYKIKYNDALEGIRELYNSDLDMIRVKRLRRRFEHIFPELKESKDERVRKGLIKAVSRVLEGHKLFSTDVTREEALAWLEKQGEQTHANLGQSEVTKTSDQELSDKIEPKFKAGDWIVINETTYQIIEIDNSHVVLSFNGRECNFGLDVFNNARLWTIADAKDGDVLTNGESIVIFKQIVEPKYRQYIEAYVGLDWGCIIQVTSEPWSLGIDKTMPATKEQRDLLFQKMKEAGCEWDSEKKELKRIELKKLDADKVIAWLVANICDFEYYVKLFKKDFGL